MTQDMLNAGLRLWEVQKDQGTGLCVGLDPHYDPKEGIGPELYQQFASPAYTEYFERLLEVMRWWRQMGILGFNSVFLGGVCCYFAKVCQAAWQNGIRIFKLQCAFYEDFQPFAGVMLAEVCQTLHTLAKDREEFFLICDAKRGDITETQIPYYRAYLSDLGADAFPKGCGQFGFDAMTVTTWMGEDVLTPGLPFFRRGKGAIVVTRSSNPSGTTLQDAVVRANSSIELTGKQEPFRLTKDVIDAVTVLIERPPTAHEVMLYQTERFSEMYGLNQHGVGPIFSVIGATVMMDKTFRKIRPNGIALIPGFGAQGGEFKNVMPLVVKEGSLAGHLGILSSSRAHNFPWLKKYGGSGSPALVEDEVRRAIDAFRTHEKRSYQEAGYDYPF